jgi:hypothetical protein
MVNQLKSALIGFLEGRSVCFLAITIKVMAYFTISIFLSAFLLFQVQPMIAKYFLPWFGGTPAVWSTVMLFFQVLLTGGYAYASWLNHSRRREVVHLALLSLSIAMIVILGLTWKSPITPSVNWKPGADASPVLEIFKLLMVSVGLPYFLISSNSPLIQSWFNQAFPCQPAYRLYALSNAGSLIALITYPVLVEPNFSLAWQGRIWSLMYLVFAGLAAFGAIRILRTKLKPSPELLPVMAKPALRPNMKDFSLWIALAATASILLLATTSHITQDIAVIPFLWVLPLTIYLLSFVLAFSGERWYSRKIYMALFFVAFILNDWAIVNARNLSIPLQLGIFSFLLFVACMICHGELYHLRPNSSYLTTFYLMVSLGGAVGGILINFVAPYVFKGYWELPFGYVIFWLLLMAVVFFTRTPDQSRPVSSMNGILFSIALLISGVFTFQYIRSDLQDSLGSWRNFYGVIRVRENGLPGWDSHNYSLVHGRTIHGVQLLDTDRRDIPTTYYGETSGCGLAILNYPKRGEGMRLGILGLGIGTLSAYGQPGDVYKFYEINPVVVDLAEGEGGYFHYLQDSQAKVEIILGDARLSLERELEEEHPQQFDVMVLDVFSSDSIPVHLLDEQAFNLYLKHLAPGGILAVNISNSFLDLVPVVWTLADHFNLSRVLINDPGNGTTIFSSIWMLLARDPALLQTHAIKERTTPMLNYTPHIRLWTDDYSNLFQILRN